MRIVTWAIRLILFLLLVAFAAKNVDPVTLRFYFDLAFELPLVVALLASFVLGALFGLVALVGALVRSRREAARLRKQLRVRTEPPPPEPPPAAPMI
ncbi:MAG TPA: LapA family protein [Burkholderiales bacterium]|nr:LapA family protein [Burkholderiales bacterium]